MYHSRSADLAIEKSEQSWPLYALQYVTLDVRSPTRYACALPSKEPKCLELAAVDVQKSEETHLGAQIHLNAFENVEPIHTERSQRQSRVSPRKVQQRILLLLNVKT